MRRQVLMYIFLSIFSISFAQDRGEEKLITKAQKADLKQEVQKANYHESLQNGNNSEFDFKYKCGTVLADELRRKSNRSASTIDEFETWMRTAIDVKKQMLTTNGPRCEVKYIPYIVHVMHTGEEINTKDTATKSFNLSSAQIESQIVHLNEAFRKMNLISRNDTDLWDDRAADLQIQFIPALINPDTNEKLKEPGVNRINLQEKGLPYEFKGTTGEVFNLMDGKVKPATIWNPDKVLNIWVGNIKGSGGLLGYAQFPDTDKIEGIPTSTAKGRNTDGVVMYSAFFGGASDADGSFLINKYSGGNTLVHEIGHFLGLRHVWGDGACGVDDYVSDTPLQGGATPFNDGDCPFTRNTCTEPTGVDFPDMVSNYMDYTNDKCMNLFTYGQKERTDIVLSNAPRRASLLASDVGNYPEKEPYVFFEVEDWKKKVKEGDDCEMFTDYYIDIRLKDCTDKPGQILVTVNVDDASTAKLGVDFDFTQGNVRSFSGKGPEVISIPVRFYNDSEVEGEEFVIFTLDVDAGGTNAIKNPNPQYNIARWYVEDAKSVNPPVLSFNNAKGGVLNQDIEESIQCSDKESIIYPLEITLDNCVFGQKAVDVEILVAKESQVTEGEDFIFPKGNKIHFDGSKAESIFLPIEIKNDYLVEGEELLVLELSVLNDVPVILNDTNKTNRLRILDSHSPRVSFVQNEIEAVEGSYDCDSTNERVSFEITNTNCGRIKGEIALQLVVDDSSTAKEGEDFKFLSGSSIVKFTPDNIGQPLAVDIELISDEMTEGQETLIFKIVPETGTGAVNVVGEPLVIRINDPKGAQPPGNRLVLLEDFESGKIPEGWNIVAPPLTQVHNFVVSKNAGLDGFSAHISNDPKGSMKYEYQGTDPYTTLYLLSPPVSAVEYQNLLVDFLYKADAEFEINDGKLILYDYAQFGVVPASVDVNDFKQVNDEFIAQTGFPIVYNTAGQTWQQRVPNYDLLKDAAKTLKNEKFRLAFYWKNDTYLEKNPPLAVDNLVVYEKTNIETEPMVGKEISEFKINKEQETYYYNKQDNDIAFAIKSDQSHGCSQGVVSTNGKEIVKFISDDKKEYRSPKTFLLSVENANEDANISVGLYFTEQEIALWETQTGLTRDNLYVFKLKGHLEKFDTTCAGYEYVDIAKATLMPYEDGFKVSASFASGLEKNTTFGISAKPAFAPSKFSAEQLEEQVNIVFETKFSESEVDYYILQSVRPDSQEGVKELKIFTVTNENKYLFTDYFPREGLNIYRVTALLKTGEKQTYCKEVNVFYNATNEFKIYPNPAKESINILVSNEDFEGKVYAEVYDINGQIVLSKRLNTVEGTPVVREKINISQLAAGEYYMRIYTLVGDQKIATFIKEEN